MSLARISGKVSAITNGSEIGNQLSSKLYGNSSFLRNSESGYGQFVDAIRDTLSIASDIGNALGIKNKMYVIGEIPRTSDKKWGWANKLESATMTAVADWVGSSDPNYQRGVRIDGFDNFKGDISVALPENPIIYKTSVIDNVVRNPNRLMMRVYVDLFHSDDIVDNLKQAALNSLGGLTNVIAGALGNDMNRVQQALDNLKFIQEQGKPFKVYTPHGVYENMLIERIQPSNDQKMNEILAADITFKEIIPTYSLGNKEETTARTAPTPSASVAAKTYGWIKDLSL